MTASAEVREATTETRRDDRENVRWATYVTIGWLLVFFVASVGLILFGQVLSEVLGGF